jgi:hypothetical protein
MGMHVCKTCKIQYWNKRLKQSNEEYKYALSLYPRRCNGGIRYSPEATTFYQNELNMRDIADVTGGKPIAVWLQPISGVCADNPLVM